MISLEIIIIKPMIDNRTDAADLILIEIISASVFIESS